MRTVICGSVPGKRRRTMKETMKDETACVPSELFDRLSRRYDEFVHSMDVFPFAGYDQVLAEVVRQAEVRSGMRILDLGIGTGNLAKRLTDAGCRLCGMDFSAEMLDVARVKVPEAVLIPRDLLDEWPDFGSRFDRVVSSYAFHHFDLATKIDLLRRAARDHLAPDGFMVIADLAFATTSSRSEVREAVGEMWEEEHHWIAAQALPALRESGFDASYRQVSSCAGVFKIRVTG